jgi:hypothetical protein
MNAGREIEMQQARDLRSRRRGRALAAALAFVAAGAALAGRAEAAPPAFVPPDVGSPQTRVTAGTRGAGTTAEVWPLAPAQTGLTAKARPTLFWCLTERFERPIELTVQPIDRHGAPLLATRLANGAAAGLHSLTLPPGTGLVPGREYQWSVVLVDDDGHPSRNPLAGGGIRREAGLGPDSYWYDLIEGMRARPAMLAQFLADAHLPRDSDCVRRHATRP